MRAISSAEVHVKGEGRLKLSLPHLATWSSSRSRDEVDCTSGRGWGGVSGTRALLGPISPEWA